MTRFLQFHTLTVYPPSNPNRDDSNRPKTVRYGFTERLRISSQSLKRAWRVSGEFLRESVGTRLANSKKTHTFKDYLKQCFSGKIDGVTPKPDIKEAEQNKIIEALIKELTNDKDVLVFLSYAEMERVHNIVRNGTLPPSNQAHYEIFQKGDLSADVAMFGRMMTENPRQNIEAAVQVSHAFTVHAGSVEDDYFTAIDDVKQKHFPELTGAFLPDSRAFGGGGVYYLYVCVDIDLLLKNLNNNTEAAKQAIQGLINAMTKVAPSGMQNSFGSRVHCEYVLAEYGERQPRSLATAFLQAVYGDKHDSPLEIAKHRLEQRQDEIDEIYGNLWEEYRVAGSPEREIKTIAENATDESRNKLEKRNERSTQHNSWRTNLQGIIEFCTSKITPLETSPKQPQEQAL
jgi:CRISPR system Cascade subunit CasC